mmetsp:Transcript_34685/g.55753  ORF Transcript_34685/g.55753 Transcript_34685/m.55753 type:complete len:262 (-) Transcript_34685:234-1019(-)
MLLCLLPIARHQFSSSTFVGRRTTPHHRHTSLHSSSATGRLNFCHVSHTILLRVRGLGDGGHLQDRRRLHEHAAVDGGSGLERRRGGTQHDTLEVRSSAKFGGACGDPDDVLGLRASGEGDLNIAGDAQLASDLEDPRVILGALDDGVGGDADVCRELVHSRGESLAAELAGPKLVEIDVEAAGGVRVGGLHVSDGSGHLHRGGGGVVGGIEFSVDLVRFREDTVRVRFEGEAGQRGLVDGRDADVAGDDGCGDGGDAGLR